jgi:stage III sporulation protein AB
MVFAVFCVMAGAIFGLYRSAELKRRERLLTELTGLLESMAMQIRYRALPLGELFAALKGGGEFMNAVGAHTAHPSAMNPREAWNKAVTGLFANEEDRDILCAVGNALGGSDTAGQLAMLELNKELLTARLHEASEQSARTGKMYRSVGLLTGLGLAIIII